MLKQLKACMLAKKLHDQFVEKYGTCRCADIQTKLVGRFHDLYDPAEMEAATKDGMMDKCYYRRGRNCPNGYGNHTGGERKRSLQTGGKQGQGVMCK